MILIDIIRLPISRTTNQIQEMPISIILIDIISLSILRMTN